MRTIIRNNLRLAFLLCFFTMMTSITIAQDKDYVEYKGMVTDANTNMPLEAVSVNLKNTNINTISNVEGKFLLKVPQNITDGVIVITYLGYNQKKIALAKLSKKENKIALEPKIIQLSEVNIATFTNAEALVKKVFEKKSENNLNEPTVMTAFYRETIKRRNRNVSLTEAVVNLYKQPYASNSKDVIELEKARKSTDYRRLDTVAFKLQGGPFSALYLDVMKYPEYLFTNETITDYTYKFQPPSTINGRPIFVVSFVQKELYADAYYKGELFIDAEKFALTSASYQLVIVDKKEASKLFVKKKPNKINVYPLETSYHVDYREKDGKWFYGYSNMQLTFKVDQKGKLFNTTYTLATEMAVTDWEQNTNGSMSQIEKRLKPTVVMSDEVSGFSDPDFWGPYNVIEPEESIESAINKIKRKLERNKG